jgi:hypothetical protein
MSVIGGLVLLSFALAASGNAILGRWDEALMSVVAIASVLALALLLEGLASRRRARRSRW